MKDKWLLLSEKLNGLSTRERGIIFATLLVALYMAFQLLVFDPLLESRGRLIDQQTNLQRQIDDIRVEIADVIAASIYDPNKEIREKIEKEQQLAHNYQQDIQNITNKLIDPGQMSNVLASLLNKESGLKLTSVKTVSAVPVTLGGLLNSDPMSEAGEAVAQNSDSQVNLYQHTLLLEMEGNYDQVDRYLSRVEALPERVFWRNLAFQMDNYPIGSLTVEVYTLSTSKDLIGVYQ